MAASSAAGGRNPKEKVWLLENWGMAGGRKK